MKLSKSRMMCYMQCPLKYKFQYIDKIEKPKPAAMTRGIEIHTTIEQALNGKPDYEKYGNIVRNVEGFIKDKLLVIKQLELWVEHENIRGFIDAVLETPNSELLILDWKSGKPKLIGDHRFELALYAYMFYKQEGVKPKYYGAYFVEHNGFVFEEWNDKVINSQLMMVGIVERGIVNGMFNAVPNQFCNWCQFKEECEK